MTISIFKKRIAVFLSTLLIALVILIAAADFTQLQNHFQVFAQSLNPTGQHQLFLSISDASDGVQSSDNTLLTARRLTGPVLLLSTPTPVLILTPTPTPCPKGGDQNEFLKREIEETTIDELPGCQGNSG